MGDISDAAKTIGIDLVGEAVKRIVSYLLKEVFGDDDKDDAAAAADRAAKAAAAERVAKALLMAAVEAARIESEVKFATELLPGRLEAMLQSIAGIDVEALMKPSGTFPKLEVDIEIIDPDSEEARLMRLADAESDLDKKFPR